MNANKKQSEREVIHLDLNVVTGKITLPANSYSQPTLVLVQESGVDDGAYYPAESINIYGCDQLRTIANACNKAVARYEERKKEDATI